MNRAFYGLVAALAATLLFAGGSAVAQQSGEIANGIVVGVQAGSGGALERFAIADQGGNIIEFTVDDSTEYGLENQAGDRWVATQAAGSVEVVERLRDHQRRFAAITVTSQNGMAQSVVERESGKLETNLGFLFAVFAITWAGFFAYVFFLSRKQRELQREVARLNAAIGSETDA